jgi:hypothetical protein
LPLRGPFDLKATLWLCTFRAVVAEGIEKILLPYKAFVWTPISAKDRATATIAVLGNDDVRKACSGFRADQIATVPRNKASQSRQSKDKEIRRQTEELAQHWSWTPPSFALFVRTTLPLYDCARASELI